eukprot:SAG22_NODE_3482_length_1687_cov_1.232997_1_plen_520_part_10
MIGDGSVRVPAGVFSNLDVAPDEVLSTVVEWTNSSTLVSANRIRPLAVISITLWHDDGHELQLGKLPSPFTINMTIDGHHQPGRISCNRWGPQVDGGSWLYDSDPVQVFETTCGSTNCTVVTCHADHLTDFALVSNELGSASDLFSVSVWANNLLGLCIVLTLAGLSIGITLYSYCFHVKRLRRNPEAVDVDAESSTQYARWLRVVGLRRMTNSILAKKILFKIRSSTVCGPLLAKLEGDPFVSSQRMVMVFITLLASLFFNILFFQDKLEPICSAASGEDGEDGEMVCKTFVCPDCYELYEDTSCGGAMSPNELCTGYLAGAFSAHQACEHRPFSACRSADGIFTDVLYGACPSGAKLLTLGANVTTPSGEHIDTKCNEFASDLRKTLVAAAISTLCTLPVLSLLDYAFSTLRAPVDRAIEGEEQSFWLRSMCKRNGDSVVQVVGGEERGEGPTNQSRKVYRAPAQIQAETPERLLHKSPRWAATVHLLAVVISVACTALVALVVVTFSADTTRAWLLT